MAGGSSRNPQHCGAFYLAVLDLAIIGLTAIKPWRRIGILGFIGLFGGLGLLLFTMVSGATIGATEKRGIRKVDPNDVEAPRKINDLAASETIARAHRYRS